MVKRSPFLPGACLDELQPLSLDQTPGRDKPSVFTPETHGRVSVLIASPAPPPSYQRLGGPQPSATNATRMIRPGSWYKGRSRADLFGNSFSIFERSSPRRLLRTRLGWQLLSTRAHANDGDAETTTTPPSPLIRRRPERCEIGHGLKLGG